MAGTIYRGPSAPWGRRRPPGMLIAVVALALGACAMGACAPGTAPAAPGSAPQAGGGSAGAAPWPGGAAAPARESPPAPLMIVRFAGAGGMGLAGRYIAMERGYFLEEGIDQQDVPSDTSAQLLPSLAAGQIDMLTGGPTSGLFNAIAQGIAVRIVLDSWSAFPGNEAGGLIVRKELVDSGRLREPADLRGLRLAITSKGHNTQMWLTTLLVSGGLTLDDVDVTELSYPNMNVALGNGSIDGATIIEPIASRAVGEGYAARWRSWADVHPNDTVSTMMYSQAFAESNTEAGRRWAKAYIRGLRDYHAARTKGTDREAVIAILQKYTELKDRALYDQMAWPSSNPDGRVNAESIARSQDWFYERGYVPTKVDLGKVIDNQFADYAVAQLGPYQP